MKKKCYIVFATGRCGTALLAQYFAGRFIDRDIWTDLQSPDSNEAGSYSIVHEPFQSNAESWKQIQRAKRGKRTSYVKKVLLPELKQRPDSNRFLITDNKIARWFLDECLRSSLEIGVLYLHRQTSDVIASLRSFQPDPKDLYWCYEAQDGDIVSKPIDDPYEFHVQETEARWRIAREILQEDQFLEVSYEEFISERSARSKVEQFVGMPGFEDRLKIRVNERPT